MGKSQIPWGFFALAGAATVLATFGAFPYLWVFPLDALGLPLWILVCAVDIGLCWSDLPFRARARLLLWCGGLLLFTARQGAPLLGVALLFASAALWISARLTRGRLLPLAAGLSVPLLAFGHDPLLLHPGMAERMADWRFGVHLFAAFAFFRMVSWLVAVRARGEEPDFLTSMEYLLAPAFWLSPMHASHLVFGHMAEAPREPGRAMGWLLRGFALSSLFSVLLVTLIPWLQLRYAGGLSQFRWWHWPLLGPALFVVSYVEKARVSYLVAGVLRLTGRDIEPDFRAPWAARNLLDYWRRFHSWLWEFYTELVFLPISASLVPRLGAERAAALGLFLTFALGTSVIHWVHYPAPFLTALTLGLLFGAATWAHLRAARWLENPRVGRPATWLTVFVLYAVAYPAFGLGWGFTELGEFLRR